MVKALAQDANCCRNTTNRSDSLEIRLAKWPLTDSCDKIGAGVGYDSCSLFNFSGFYWHWGNPGWLRVDASQWAGGRRRALGWKG
jgi:hypothetical protein